MKKKLIILTSTLIIASMILVILYNFYIVNASPALTTLSGSDYDTAMGYDVNNEFNASAGVSGSNGPANQACFHNDALDAGTGGHKIVSKVVIDVDGTMTITKANGSVSTVTEQKARSEKH